MSRQNSTNDRPRLEANFLKLGFLGDEVRNNNQREVCVCGMVGC